MKYLYLMGEIYYQFFFVDCVVINLDIEFDMFVCVFELLCEKFVSVFNGVELIFYDCQFVLVFRDVFDLCGCFILNVGNIELCKNQFVFVCVMKLFFELKFVLIGYQCDQVYVCVCFEEGGDQVIYLGVLLYELLVLCVVYVVCEVFCLFSMLEMFGLVVFEVYVVGVCIVIM